MAETLRAERASEAEDPEREPRWYACYTRSRHEKQVERLLRERGFDAFLPVVPRTMQWKDRKKKVDWPLFPSYVFSRFELAEAHRVLSTPGVVTLVSVSGRPAPIPDAELENVKRFAAGLSGGNVRVEETPQPFYAAGEWVEIMSGPLAGVRGVVIVQRNRRRLLIGLQTIGQGLEVDVEAAALRAVTGP